MNAASKWETSQECTNNIYEQALCSSTVMHNLCVRGCHYTHVGYSSPATPTAISINFLQMFLLHQPPIVDTYQVWIGTNYLVSNVRQNDVIHIEYIGIHRNPAIQSRNIFHGKWDCFVNTMKSLVMTMSSSNGAVCLWPAP